MWVVWLATENITTGRIPLFYERDDAFLTYVREQMKDSYTSRDELADELDTVWYMFSHIILSNYNLATEFAYSPLREIECENGFRLLVRQPAEDLILIAGISADVVGTGLTEVHRRLDMLLTILHFLYGPSYDFHLSRKSTLEQRKFNWDSISLLLNKWHQMFNNEQCYLVEAIEEIATDSAYGGRGRPGDSLDDKADAILNEAYKIVRLKLGCTYDYVIHTMLVVENKIVKFSSSEKDRSVSPYDILLMLLSSLAYFPSNMVPEDLFSRPQRKFDYSRSVLSEESDEDSRLEVPSDSDAAGSDRYFVDVMLDDEMASEPSDNPSVHSSDENVISADALAKARRKVEFMIGDRKLRATTSYPAADTNNRLPRRSHTISGGTTPDIGKAFFFIAKSHAEFLRDCGQAAGDTSSAGVEKCSLGADLDAAIPTGKGQGLQPINKLNSVDNAQNANLEGLTIKNTQKKPSENGIAKSDKLKLDKNFDDNSQPSKKGIHDAVSLSDVVVEISEDGTAVTNKELRSGISGTTIKGETMEATQVNGLSTANKKADNGQPSSALALDGKKELVIDESGYQERVSTNYILDENEAGICVTSSNLSKIDSVKEAGDVSFTQKTPRINYKPGTDILENSTGSCSGSERFDRSFSESSGFVESSNHSTIANSWTGSHNTHVNPDQTITENGESKGVAIPTNNNHLYSCESKTAPFNSTLTNKPELHKGLTTSRSLPRIVTKGVAKRNTRKTMSMTAPRRQSFPETPRHRHQSMTERGTDGSEHLTEEYYSAPSPPCSPHARRHSDCRRPSADSETSFHTATMQMRREPEHPLDTEKLLASVLAKEDPLHLVKGCFIHKRVFLRSSLSRYVPACLYIISVSPGINILVAAEITDPQKPNKFVEALTQLSWLLHPKCFENKSVVPERLIERMGDRLRELIDLISLRIHNTSYKTTLESMLTTWQKSVPLLRQCYREEEKIIPYSLRCSLLKISEELKKSFRALYMTITNLSDEAGDHMNRLQLYANKKLRFYKPILLVKANRNMAMSAFHNDKYPGLVHFIYVNRNNNTMKSPSIQLPKADYGIEALIIRDMKVRLWKVLPWMYKQLSNGYTSISVKDGDFVFTFDLFMYDEVRYRFFPRMVAHPSLYNPPRPAIGDMKGYFYKRLIKITDSVAGIKCLELLTVHFAVIPRDVISKQRTLLLENELHKKHDPLSTY